MNTASCIGKNRSCIKAADGLTKRFKEGEVTETAA